MTVREFAEHLGVSHRMVSRWEADGTHIRPRPVNQAALDTSLRLVDSDARARCHHRLDRVEMLAIQRFMGVAE